MIFEVSASMVAGVVGWNESLYTVIAPPRIVVSLPPVDVVRVAQPETKAVATSRVANESLVFMGTRRRRTVGVREKFRKGRISAALASAPRSNSFHRWLVTQQVGL